MFEKPNKELKLIIATKTTIDFIDDNGITLKDEPIEMQKDEEIEEILHHLRISITNPFCHNQQR